MIVLQSSADKTRLRPDFEYKISILIAPSAQYIIVCLIDLCQIDPIRNPDRLTSALVLLCIEYSAFSSLGQPSRWEGHPVAVDCRTHAGPPSTRGPHSMNPSTDT